ncbi:peptidase S8/S53 domain-containing protein [Haematococcus lacustris]
MAPLRAASVEAAAAIQEQEQSGLYNLVAESKTSGAEQIMMAAEDVGVEASLPPYNLALPPSLSYVKTRTGVTRVLLLALGAKPADQTAAASWAASLAMELTAALPHAVPACYAIVKAVGTTGAVEVAVCLPDVDAAVSWLATQPSVTWVEYASQTKATNLLASAQMQTGRVAPPLPDDGGARGYHPLWDAGLDGAGQLVGVVDSGLDMGSCYFWDPAFANFSSDPANLYTDTDTGTRYFHNSAHRKASQAPAAKLAFYDVGRGGGNSLNITIDPGFTFEPLYQAGARIVSNSWGTDEFSYSGMSLLLDTYLWSRPDLLMLFAAGNELLVVYPLTLHGNSAEVPDTQLAGNVGSHALAKNVVAVGATDNYTPLDIGLLNLTGANNSQVQIPPRFMKPFQYVIKAEALNQSRATQAEAVVPLVPWYFPLLQWSSLQNRTLELVLADPLDACTPLVGNYTGKPALPIVFITAIWHLLHAGIVANNASDMLFAEGAGLANSSIPLMGLSGLHGRQLMDMFANGWNVTLTSYQDVRIKPEVMAPGALLSAHASGGPHLGPPPLLPSLIPPSSSRLDGAPQLGTQAAKGPGSRAPSSLPSLGAAKVHRQNGQVRQYFTDGYYPTGARVRSDAFNPSASLLRAMLVAGTTNMSSVTSSGLTPYDVRHGFGLVDIGRSLPLRGGPSTWKLQYLVHAAVWQGWLRVIGWAPCWVVNRAVFSRPGQSHTYRVRATGRSALIITLAYMDWPAFPGVATLVNDLDLKVTAPRELQARAPLLPVAADGAVLWGNDFEGGDFMNNIEKLVIPYPRAGVYTVQVSAYYLFITARPQPYSLVVLGGVNTTRTLNRVARH